MCSDIWDINEGQAEALEQRRQMNGEKKHAAYLCRNGTVCPLHDASEGLGRIVFRVEWWVGWERMKNKTGGHKKNCPGLFPGVNYLMYPSVFRLVQHLSPTITWSSSLMPRMSAALLSLSVISIS